MKRMFSFFLALALLAVLSGCGKREPTPSRPDEPTPPPEEGITLAELNVEFVAGDRDTDALIQLKKELPPLLIGALADEGVTVGRVNVTFGASDEATADALARGSVQVGFMPMETYLAHEDTLRTPPATRSVSDCISRSPTRTARCARRLKRMRRTAARCTRGRRCSAASGWAMGATLCSPCLWMTMWPGGFSTA